MYTDFNHFFTVRTRHLWRIKRILRLPPHLYSVTALPSKTYTTANIDVKVWLIDVNGPSATTEVAVMRLIKHIQARLQCSICSCILRGYDCKKHHLDCIPCPESLKFESLKRYQLSLETSDGHCPWPEVVIFFSQTIHTYHRPSLVGNFFY